MKAWTCLLTVVGFVMATSYLYGASGSLDPSFGAGGKVTTDFSGGADDAWAMAIQLDGKIVVAGVTGIGPSHDFALVRYNTNGTLDTTFGVGGRVTTDFSGNPSGAHAVAIQLDGRIVAAGFTGISGSGTHSDFALARYNTDGTLDTSFGIGGKITTDFWGQDDHADGLVIQLDGKIVAAGGALTGSTSSDFALARYNANGTLDTSFGSGGRVTTDFTTDPDFAFDVRLQSDGKIVAAGYTLNFNNSNFEGHLDFAIARYNTNGVLDAGFGAGGTVSTDFSGNGFGDEEAFSVAIQPDGKIVAAGYAFSSGTGVDFALARYDANGTLDTAFGTGGVVTTDFPGSGAQAFGVANQLDGKIVAAGLANTGGAGDFALARYSTNGTLDISFGTAGKVTTDFSGSGDIARAVAIQGDGKIVAAGVAAYSSSSSDFALARYEGPTPEDLITFLSDQVQDLGNTGVLNQGQGNSLTVKLTNVLNSLSQGKTNTACQQLNAFINQVNAHVSSGLLTVAQGRALLNVAAAIEQMLGC